MEQSLARVWVFWFNAPCQNLYGDTGSLSLGGSLGAVGIITKHEIVGDHWWTFVLEAVSVMVQVISFKLTGKGSSRCSNSSPF